MKSAPTTEEGKSPRPKQRIFLPSDALHLNVSLLTSRPFLVQLLNESRIRQVLWNVERLIAASQLKPYRRLEAEHGLTILSAVPIQEIAAAAAHAGLSEEDRKRLQHFVAERWKRVEGGKEKETEKTGGTANLR